MPLKFLHTADWQIGMKASHVGDVGEVVRNARLESLERLPEIARSTGAEFILVAGDCFESNSIHRLLVQKTADILSNVSCPIIIIPGNHDPAVTASVWEHPAWQSRSQITVARQAHPIELDGATIYPCPCLRAHSREDPTAWVTHTSDRFGIGLAHGTLEGIPTSEPDYPISLDAPARCGLHYLALGHWHSYYAVRNSRGEPRMAYSGSHEPTKFGERESGSLLLVEIDSLESAPRLTPIPTAKLRWEDLAIEVRTASELENLLVRVEQLPHPEITLLRLKLSGILPENGQALILRLEELTKSRALYSRVITESLSPAPSDTAWLSALPPGAIRETALRLHQYAQPDCNGRPTGVTPELASRALLELYALERNGGR